MGILLINRIIPHMALDRDASLPLVAQLVATPLKLVKLGRESVAALYVIEPNPGPKGRKNRKGRKTRGRSGGATLMKSPGLPFADRLKCRLTVSQVISITDPDSFTDVIISGNSPFDPFAAIGSAQPAYYDQLSALYGCVVVHASHVSFNLMDTQSAVQGRQFRCGIAPRDLSTAYSTASDLLSNARAIRRDANMAGGEVTVRNSAKTVQVLGLKDVFQCQAAATVAVSCVLPTDANPSSEWFWHMTAQTPVVGTDISIQLDTRITYDCEFFDRLAAGLSFERMLSLRARREEYLGLKAKTPDKSGRVPKPASVSVLKSYVDSVSAGVEPTYVVVPEARERKEVGATPKKGAPVLVLNRVP